MHAFCSCFEFWVCLVNMFVFHDVKYYYLKNENIYRLACLTFKFQNEILKRT